MDENISTIDKKIEAIKIPGETRDESRNKVLDKEFLAIIHKISQRKFKANLDYCKVQRAVLDLTSDEFFSYKISYSEMYLEKSKAQNEGDEEDEAWEDTEKTYCRYLCAIEKMHVQKEQLPTHKKVTKRIRDAITENLKDIYRTEKSMIHKVKTSLLAWKREDKYLRLLNA